MAMSVTESRNGTRHPHAANCAGVVAAVMTHRTPVARISPIGTPIWGKAPNMPRLPRGACSTASRAAPPHSPPAEKHWRTRSRIRAAGAVAPICP